MTTTQDTSPGSQPFRTEIQPLQEALKQGLAVVTELWFHSTTDWITSVHSADIDGDGDIEVVVGSRDGTMRVLTKRGLVKWQEQEESLSWIGAVYGINNIEATDATRIVTGSRNGKVRAFNETGHVLWQFQTGRAVRRVRVDDIDHDGKAEVIIASEDRNIYALSCATGELRWKYLTNGWIRSVAMDDLDGDGHLETLAASGDQTLYILDSQGNVQRTFHTNSKIHSLYTADLDNDGVPEILYGSNFKDLRAIRPDGTEIWKFDAPNRIHSINAIDLNNDGKLEVIAASEDEHIYFLDSQGNLIWKHYLGHRIFSIFTIDLNRDGIWEILVGSDDNNVHALRVELTEGLITRIQDCYDALNQPQLALSYLSPTEKTLLQDLTNTWGDEYLLTVSDTEHLLASQNYYEALAALLRLQNQHVQVLWAKSLGHLTTLDLYDATPEKPMDIFVGSDEGEVKKLNLRGETIWSYTFGERVRSIQVTDLDADGNVEIIASCIDGHVHVLDHMGKAVLRQIRFNSEVASIWTTKGKGVKKPEILIWADRKIHSYDGYFTSTIEPITTSQGNQVICSYDLDNDGHQEIIIGTTEDRLYIYNRQGELQWSFDCRDRVKSLCVRDIDHDGHVEILAGTEDRNLYVLDYTGKHLKWRFYMPHHVQDVDAIDADNDGNIEIFAGVADSTLYVLNHVGDIIWQFSANDRIRVVRVGDVDRDGNVEVLLASEDKLYMLQMLDKEILRTKIELCWHALLENYPFEEIIHALIRHPNPYLRAFALHKLAAYPQRLTRDISALHTLIADDSPEVKHEFAAEIATLHAAVPQFTRTILEMLSTDQQAEVRQSFLHYLPLLCEVDSVVGFEYFDRFTRNINRWLRRTVVRKLELLAEKFPQQVFPLLLNTIHDETNWINQESARALAHYFDIHTSEVLLGMRLLVSMELKPILFQIMLNSSKQPSVRDNIRVLSSLIGPLTRTTVLDHVAETVETLRGTRHQSFGSVYYKIYYELYHLHRLRTIDQIAQYRCMLDNTLLESLADKQALHFDETMEVLHRLNEVTSILRTYLRREGLGDRISSLLEATTAIHILLEDLDDRYFSWCQHQETFPDYNILKLLLERWGGFITTELGLQRGKAELRPTLQTRRSYQEEVTGVVLSVQNVGRSPADRVTIKLHQNNNFTAIGPTSLAFDTIPTHEPILAEFTIHPQSTTLHLAFTIIYDDAESKGKALDFGDRLELVEHKKNFQRLRNPYYPGTPIQNQNMFYGREAELELLQEDFVYSSANTVVVLYGQRRSGKTSLLYKLLQTPILDPHIPVRIDMQHETLDFTVARFLRNIAYYISRELKRRDIHLQLPDRNAFDEDATFTLDTFLDAVEMSLQDRKLVILIDEFEVLEEQVNRGELDRNIFVYLRSLMQDRRGIHFLLAGTHTIKELTAEYWSVFFNIAKHRHIYNLSQEAAHQLIIQPLENQLEFDPFAIEKIRRLSGDQPYLIQLFCHTLVQHCNTYQKNYVTINDINIVQESVMETGNIYFNWIWDQSGPEERALLSIIAQEGGEEGRYISLTDFERVYQDNGLIFRRENVIRALHNLHGGDFITEASHENRYKISVGLTRAWLRETKPLHRIILEENLLDI